MKKLKGKKNIKNKIKQSNSSNIFVNVNKKQQNVCGVCYKIER